MSTTFSEKELNIIDANLDRAKEGLRVCEDITRFVLEHKPLMNALKDQRHACTKALKDSKLSTTQLLSARKKRTDVGQYTFSKGEKSRKSEEDLLAANFSRVQESFRVLEELFKKTNPFTAFQFKQLRFKNYELQNSVMLSFERNKKIKKFEQAKLYAVLTLEKESPNTYLKITKKLLSAGVKIIQLRPKTLSDKTFLKTAKKLRAITENKALFIIDNRPDLAVLCNADGVHIGQNDLSVKECRSIIGFDKLIGKSTHSKKQILSTLKESPDYSSVGPIFETKSVPYKTAGLGIISSAKKQKIPFVAIGGIDESNVKKVIQKGAERVAVITALTKSKNPTKTAKKLMSLIK